MYIPVCVLAVFSQKLASCISPKFSGQIASQPCESSPDKELSWLV